MLGRLLSALRIIKCEQETGPCWCHLRVLGKLLCGWLLFPLPISHWDVRRIHSELHGVLGNPFIIQAPGISVNCARSLAEFHRNMLASQNLKMLTESDFWALVERSSTSSCSWFTSLSSSCPFSSPLSNLHLEDVKISHLSGGCLWAHGTFYRRRVRLSDWVINIGWTRLFHVLHTSPVTVKSVLCLQEIACGVSGFFCFF